MIFFKSYPINKDFTITGNILTKISKDMTEYKNPKNGIISKFRFNNNILKCINFEID